MKLITYITNYDGLKKINFLNEIINSLEDIDVKYHKVKIFTTDNIIIESKKIDIEIIKEKKIFSESKYANSFQPEPNFIWLHRNHLNVDKDKYDVLCHLEDDIKLTKVNFNSFIEENKKLPNNKVIGFLVYEEKNKVKKIVSMHLGFFKKYINSIKIINEEKYFIPENLHSASWILEKRNLDYALNCGLNNTATPKMGYNVKCTACTEFYLYLEKLIPINNLENFLIKHLSLKYFNKIGDLNSITLEKLKKLL